MYEVNESYINLKYTLMNRNEEKEKQKKKKNESEWPDCFKNWLIWLMFDVE